MTRKAPIKLDGRRMINQRAAQTRSAEGRNGRGQDFVIHGGAKSKRDPHLQERIDLVVEMAKASERDHCVDVVHDGKLWFSSSRGLKVHRVG